MKKKYYLPLFLCIEVEVDNSLDDDAMDISESTQRKILNNFISNVNTHIEESDYITDGAIEYLIDYQELRKLKLQKRYSGD